MSAQEPDGLRAVVTAGSCGIGRAPALRGLRIRPRTGPTPPLYAHARGETEQ
jgi:hypothetical protein